MYYRHEEQNRGIWEVVEETGRWVFMTFAALHNRRNKATAEARRKRGWKKERKAH